MRKIQHYKHLKAREYKKIKEMIGLGVSSSTISKITNRSISLINNVKKSEDFSQYKGTNKKTNEMKQMEIGGFEQTKTDCQHNWRIHTYERTLIDNGEIARPSSFYCTKCLMVKIRS